MSAIYVEITATRGSAPRDAGTAMKVTHDSTHGTIGGGALELRAIRQAREMLAEYTDDRQETIPLGPGLGQCCGGAVTLLFTRFARSPDKQMAVPLLSASNKAPAIPLWVWGAGHVGRAIVRQTATCQAFDVTWIDTNVARFPAGIPVGVTAVPTSDMPALTGHAPRGAHHLILTYSHDIDLALCAALLKRSFAWCGLIGSDTKRARFTKRLRAMGLDPARITCPIGDRTLGKHPDAIAHGTLAALLAHQMSKETA